MFENITFEFWLILLASFTSFATFIISIASRLYRYDVEKELITYILSQKISEKELTQKEKIELLYTLLGKVSIIAYTKNEKFQKRFDELFFYPEISKENKV
jgi:hypothetical protein